jgi:hypothetical protein
MGRDVVESGDRPALPLGEDFLCERLDCVARELDELIERGNNRLTVNNLTLSERYLKGELQVLIAASARSGSNTHNFRVIVQRKLPISRLEKDSWEVGQLREDAAFDELSESFAEVHANVCVRGPYGNNHSVLIQDIQLVDAPENCVVPSVIWLEPLDCCNSTLRGALYLHKTAGYNLSGLPFTGNCA